MKINEKDEQIQARSINLKHLTENASGNENKKEKKENPIKNNIPDQPKHDDLDKEKKIIPFSCCFKSDSDPKSILYHSKSTIIIFLGKIRYIQTYFFFPKKNIFVFKWFL